MVFPIVGGNQSSGDIVTNSLLFNNDDSAYLEKSLSSPNTDKFTVAFWVKISGQRANVWSIGKRLTGETGDYYALTVDLGTGTDIDNIYMVTDVTHSIGPGEYSTSITVAMPAQGTVKSTQDRIVTMINAVGEVKEEGV